MNRNNDEIIVIGGGDTVDEMEKRLRRGSAKAEAAPVTEIEKEESESEKIDFSEPVTLGGEKAEESSAVAWESVKTAVADDDKVKAAEPEKKPTVAERIKEATVGEETEFEKKFLVTSSPHLHCGETTRILMQDVIIALMPAAIASIIFYGWRAAMLIVLCIVTCCLTEFICRKVMKRRQTVGDYSAAVTGMLLAFCLPPTINPLFAVFGCIVAIVVVKQMFGGIGMNFANPAATARIVMMLSFTAAMTTYVRPFFYLNGSAADAVSSATPLAAMVEMRGGAASSAMPSLLELLFGFHAGCLGETCAIALLLGGGYLLMRGVITWEIPVAFMGTVALFAMAVGENPLYHILTGGVILGAVFMATDYVTSPINSKGKLIYGIGCGLLTMCIRLFCSMNEGVSFAILLMNIITPHIDNLTLHRAFGEEREHA